MNVSSNNIEKWDLTYEDPANPSGGVDPITGEPEYKTGFAKFGEMGYFGLNYPEQYDGLNLDLFYTVIFLEELQKELKSTIKYLITLHRCRHMLLCGKKEQVCQLLIQLLLWM